MSLIGFNKNSVDTTDHFSALPTGWYDCVIEDVEDSINSKNTGRVLKLTFQIIKGPFQNRKIFGFIGYENISEKAHEIGQQQLGRLMEACDIEQLKYDDGSDFLKKRLEVRARPDEDKEGYTKVVGYRNIDPEKRNKKTNSTQATASKPKKSIVEEKQEEMFDDDIPF